MPYPNLHFLTSFSFLFLVLGSYLFELFPRLGAVRASWIFHAYMLAAVLRAPMQFVDTTPVGRILARFSSDLEAVDNKLNYMVPDVYYFFLQVFFLLFFSRFGQGAHCFMVAGCTNSVTSCVFSALRTSKM